jgi:hypothetical protein
LAQATAVAAGKVDEATEELIDEASDEPIDDVTVLNTDVLSTEVRELIVPEVALAVRLVLKLLESDVLLVGMALAEEKTVVD